MGELRRAPAGPGQAIVVAIGRAAFGAQVLETEGVPVLLVSLETLRTLAGVTHGPHATVDFAKDIFDQRFLAVDLDMAGELVGEAELLGEQVHDLMVGTGFEQRLDDLVTPLQRAVGGGDAAVCLELSGRR
ncbi:hypothetical protein Q427_01370 [Halomonas sp. BC04]|nr:hypothetical protein Q427_01370 [Halomonas sp. BC04]